MGLKTASDVTRLGKKYTEQDTKAKRSNPKMGMGDRRKGTGIVRASK
ncbi:MAG: hypothetical protein AABX98_00340 [Nanoarchaeota archaeon]